MYLFIFFTTANISMFAINLYLIIEARESIPWNSLILFLKGHIFKTENMTANLVHSSFCLDAMNNPPKRLVAFVAQHIKTLSKIFRTYILHQAKTCGDLDFLAKSYKNSWQLHHIIPENGPNLLKMSIFSPHHISSLRHNCKVKYII